MTSIKINFTDFWQGFIPEKSFFYLLLAKHYKIELSENPDILFYSVYSTNHERFNCTKVLFTGENIRPDFNQCDFAFSFDYPITKKNYRLPLYALYNDVNLLINKTADLKLLNLKNKKFCCFVVSNPVSLVRNNFFEKLNKIKPVDSGGTLFNNVGGPITNKSEFIRQYKFVIAFENSSYPGYVTEKIFEPLLEDCVPIYWGSDLVKNDFNTKRFINCHDYKDFDEVINHLIKLDNDDEAYLEYLNQPAFVNNELNEYVRNENIIKRLEEIIAFSGSKNFTKTIKQNIRVCKYYLKRIHKKIKSFA